MKKIVSLFVITIAVVTAVLVSGCSKVKDFEYLTYDDGIKIISASDEVKSRDKLILPDEIDGKTVVSIGEGAFAYSKFQTVTFSKNILKIENSAFKNSKSLFDVRLNDGLTYIGDFAFVNCSNLVSITFPYGLTTIGDHAFYHARSLSSISFETKSNDENEDKFTYGPKLRYIGDFAFYDTHLYSSIIFDFDIDYIGAYAFSYTHIQGLVFQNVKEIGSYAFAYCPNLQTIRINNVDTLKYGEGIFSNCYELQPESIRIYGLTPNGITPAFKGYPYIRNVTLVGQYVFEEAFSDCYFLEKVTFTDKVEVIGESAFSNCYSLEEITIPENVREIGQYAFNNCSKLKKFTVLGNPTIRESGIFKYSSTDEINAKVFCKDNTYIKDYCIKNNIDYEIIT